MTVVEITYEPGPGLFFATLGDIQADGITEVGALSALLSVLLKTERDGKTPCDCCKGSGYSFHKPCNVCGATGVQEKDGILESSLPF